jgi:hypothetical protein
MIPGCTTADLPNTLCMLMRIVAYIEETTLQKTESSQLIILLQNGRFALLIGSSVGISAAISWQSHSKSTDFKYPFSTFICFCVIRLPSHRTGDCVFSLSFSIGSNVEVNYTAFIFQPMKVCQLHT